MSLTKIEWIEFRNFSATCLKFVVYVILKFHDLKLKIKGLMKHWLAQMDKLR